MYSDVFVFLDNVKFVKRQWHNRNQIRTSDGTTLLTVPIIAHSGENINEVKISYDETWNTNHKKKIRKLKSKILRKCHKGILDNMISYMLYCIY